MTIKYLVLAITISIALRNCCALTLDGGDTLLLGDSLTGNQTLISKNGTFALGFFSSSGTKNWYIGIWYAPISQKAIVWVANRENPVRNMPGVLQFSRDGHLRLFDSRKGRSVWSTDMGQKGSRAVITDSGNFIVLDGHNKSAIVWESFAHPTNTWLPGMKMWKGMKLTSWKSSSNPASGLFSFGMDMSPGEMQTMMFYNTSVPYRSSGECTANYFTKVPELEGQKKFEVSCVKLSPSRIYISFSINPIDHTLTGRLLLDENGELQLYLWMDDHRWSLRWSTYRGQCSDFEICGAYGLCNANDVCSCVQGFTPKHDSQGWWSSGCTRRRALQCSVTEGTTDGFSEAKNQYLSEKEAVIYNEPSQRGCRTACLNNCSCTAFAFSNSDSPVCRLWFGDLFGMRFSSEGQSVFIRLAASELRQSTSERRIKAPALGILVSAAAVFSVVSALLLAAFVLWKYRRLWKTDMEEKVPLSLKRFSYKELRIATDNFKHKLGSGAFGSVFKGILADNTLVAIKRLEGSVQGEKQFYAEIITVGRIQHVNLVRLWGFCVERSRRLLVYAYMPNGSLNSFLFPESEDAEKVLDWKTRFQIAVGTARGLVYLHEECRDRIIHCDIKPENILLDGDFSPKIADFGLAKLVGRDFSRVLTTTRGTRGYLAPEWISGLPITPKVDVYSFGMTLLEIISGRRNLDLKVQKSRFYFPTWASSQIQKGDIIDLLDARIASEAYIEEVRRAAVVAGLCIQDDENERPSMSEVVKILEGTLEAPVPQIPKYLQVLVDQVDDDDRDGCSQSPISSASVPIKPVASFRS
ncbi:G-type lectin S-receptor-like serine/threonine-protein kinase At2g19130 [Cryptomeria japonica]|uniref:G-type lectin S-receptor-like serine/threonine-protein kinase At2g19130 n=1 Tax=Cryptomeria japonica TaxID=3369 RepID=UPI0027DA274F|nr:G-type lectin S-receptor-like serine/threonine-protein kinase At2g19130 [Cryptomeria japonica]